MATDQDWSAAAVASDYLHHLVEIGVPLAGADPVGDAVSQVVTQEQVSDLVQRGARRPDLDQYLRAVALLFDHPGDTPDLAQHSLEPDQEFLLAGLIGAATTAVPLRTALGKFDSGRGRGAGGGRGSTHSATTRADAYWSAQGWQQKYTGPSGSSKVAPGSLGSTLIPQMGSMAIGVAAAGMLIVR